MSAPLMSCRRSMLLHVVRGGVEFGKQSFFIIRNEFFDWILAFARMTGRWMAGCWMMGCWMTGAVGMTGDGMSEMTARMAGCRRPVSRRV